MKAAIQTPWSENYWPSKRGSINYRWNAKKAWGFKYNSPTKEEVQAMSIEERKELSPVEKYDLAMGHYDYPFRQSVDEEMADKKARSWEGLCNGWSPASLYYPEPKPVMITNPDGIVIPFGSSDVKGLLSYFMAVAADDQIEVSQVGLRCDDTPFMGVGADECDDVNAGALHVILTNEIGIRKRGFVVDIQRTKQVWNQPVYGYEMTEVGSAKSTFSDHAVRIKATILYGSELAKSMWSPVVGTSNNKIDSMKIEYTLELDANDKIVGGEWITKRAHPDFIWRVDNQKSIQFKGAMAGLNQIYQPVTK